MSGITAAATGAIAGAVFVLARHSIHDVATSLIACLSLLALWCWKVPEPIIVALLESQACCCPPRLEAIEHARRERTLLREFAAALGRLHNSKERMSIDIFQREINQMGFGIDTDGVSMWHKELPQRSQLPSTFFEH